MAVAVAFVAYCAVAVFVTCHHEFWEDEVRAWSLAREADTLPDLFESLRDEGHPPLWYLVLFAGTRVSDSPAVLPVCSLLVAAAAIACFLLWSPFGWWLKALFLCGILPLYEYSVMARSYGLVMLTLFAACALYPWRLQRPLPLAATLALLANTSAHGAILAAGLAASIAAEWVLGGGQERPAAKGSSIAALLVVVAGFASALALAWPDSASAVFHPEALSVSSAAHALGRFLAHPAHQFPIVFGARHLLLGAALIWLLALALLDKPYLLGAFLFGAAGLSVFLELVYSGPRRHQGVLVLLIVAAAWLASEARAVPLWQPLQRAVVFLRRFALPLALAALFARHAVAAYNMIRFDLEHDMTSARAFGELLRQKYPNAVVMGEPDSPLESLPFYAPNLIYIPREHRFGNWTHFTSANQRDLSLYDLVSIGKSLRAQTRQPVLLALGHDLSGNPSIIAYGSSLFAWSRTQRAMLRHETTLVASFHGAPLENYDVFSFR
jgi:hypothetical protein